MNVVVTNERRIINEAQALLEATRQREHRDCAFCGSDNRAGLRVDFRVLTPGSVHGRFDCLRRLQSYPETLHGGISGALLDAAMTNCLFSLGVVAVTAELTVRYLKPIQLDRVVEVTGMRKSQNAPLYYMVGELQQDGVVVARGKATFFERACVDVSGKS
jgi:acyl-coenzyme A thioesterase PaaI-like protein